MLLGESRLFIFRAFAFRRVTPASWILASSSWRRSTLSLYLSIAPLRYMARSPGRARLFHIVLELLQIGLE